jgi:hypothetical protein
VTFVALVEAAGDVVDLFKFLGLIHPKEVSPAEQLKKSKKDLEEFNAANERKIGPISPEDFAKRTALEAAVTAADANAYKPVTNIGTDGKVQKSKLMSQEEFVRAYADASGPLDSKPEVAAKQRAAMEQHARELAQRLISDPTAHDDVESRQQRELVRNFSTDAGYGKADAQPATPGDGGTQTQDTGAIALNDAAKALTAAADALKKGQGGSITGGTSP